MPRLSPLAIAAALTAALAGGSQIALAQDDVPASVQARKALMDVNGYSMGILGGMAKGEIEYDAAMAASAARNIHALSMIDPASLWVEGTAQGTVPGTRAKAEIWEDMDDFKADLKSLGTTSEPLIEAAGKDLESLRAALGPVGKVCGDCHEEFRGPKNE